jgi:hypothetical protein
MDFKNIPTFGVAGNFTGHLEQAGEASDFVNVAAATGAPKAIFPTYMPGAEEPIPQFLGVYPFDEEKILYPAGESKLQIEPECALVFDVTWNEDKMASLKPVCFGASNDCSIRKEGSRKISIKKNWGPCSKGFAISKLINLASFDKDSLINDYRIASFLVRDGVAYAYGEDSAIKDYSYIYDMLTEWMLEKFNNQKNEGPAEEINLYLNKLGRPEKIMVSIGATRYTDFGEHNFLKENDEAVVILYPQSKYTAADIEKLAADHDFSASDISVLCQKVVLY